MSRAELLICDRCGEYLDPHPLGPFHIAYRWYGPGITECLACGAVRDAAAMAHGCQECGRVDMLARDCPAGPEELDPHALMPAGMLPLAFGGRFDEDETVDRPEPDDPATIAAVMATPVIDAPALFGEDA